MPCGWLLVVRRDRQDRYLDLCQVFKGDSQVAVILERRSEADRRGESRPVDTERRRRERRGPMTPAERTFWEHAGYRVVHLGAGSAS